MPVDVAPTLRFRAFMKAAGKLAAARQISALLFAGAVLALPLWVSRSWVTDFVWAYFAMLTLTSLLGLGFERLATTVMSQRDEAHGAGFSSLVVLRLATAPVAALALWVMMAFVGVSLSFAAWCATLVWVMAALTTLVGFGGLRALKNSSVEPSLLLASRAAQAVLLCAAAAGGAQVELAIAGVAGIEVLSALLACKALGTSVRRAGSVAGILRLPWRHVMALAGIEVVALAYLRADLLLVGRILGAGVGATYGMIYRVIDALSSAIGSVGLWLFAESVTGAGDASAAEEFRARSLALLPRVAFAVAVGAILISESVGSIAELSRSETIALQLLISAFPLLAVNSVELHARSGSGRNREVLRIGTAALFVNVPLCLVLIPAFGLVGASLALVASETTESTLLVAASSPSERTRLGSSIGCGILCAVVLIALGAAVHTGALVAVAGVFLVAVGVLSVPLIGRIRNPVVTP